MRGHQICWVGELQNPRILCSKLTMTAVLSESYVFRGSMTNLSDTRLKGYEYKVFMVINSQSLSELNFLFVKDERRQVLVGNGWVIFVWDLRTPKPRGINNHIIQWELTFYRILVVSVDCATRCSIDQELQLISDSKIKSCLSNSPVYSNGTSLDTLQFWIYLPTKHPRGASIHAR